MWVGQHLGVQRGAVWLLGEVAEGCSRLCVTWPHPPAGSSGRLDLMMVAWTISPYTMPAYGLAPPETSSQTGQGWGGVQGGGGGGERKGQRWGKGEER